MDISKENIIQLLENENSITNVIKILGISKSKFYRIVKMYGIDTGKYVKSFKPDIEELKRLINEEYLNSTQLGERYNVNRRTVEKFCKDNGIPITNNRLKNKLSIPKDELVKMIDSGMTYNEIADKVGTNVSTLKTYISRSGLKVKKRMKTKIKFNNAIICFIKELIDCGYSNRDIASMLNVNRTVILRLFKELNLNNPNSSSIVSSSYRSKFKDNHPNANRDELDKMFYEKHLKISKKAEKVREELYRLNNDYSFIETLEESEREYIKKHINDVPMYEICKSLKRSSDTVNDYCVRNAIFPSFSKHYTCYPEDEQFYKDIMDRSLSVSDIAYKYNVSNSLAGRWRDEIVGKSFRVKNDSVYRMTLPERKCAEALLELDVVYFYEHKIDKYKVDFYLGSKRIIEVQGEYWHNLEKVTIADKNKKEYFKNNGYRILYIDECELDDKEKVKNTILDFINGSV